MPKAQYELYRSQVFRLAKTMVIKSDAAAFTINDQLKLMQFPVNDEDPTTWKYYLNLAGLYHATDKPMTVVSLDTLQTIDFTVENLRYHRATAEAYRFGTRYYNELVSRYPDQEFLILGILNPVTFDKSLSAPNGKILYYDRTLVEENEENLIELLQQWVDGFFARWHVSAYQMTDELYVPSLLLALYHYLPLAIMNIRNANCHTRYAHSFHIREFLSSHGRLDQFIDYLTKEQMLWLYRNIRYIHRNPGKQDTFNWLVENILTKRGIPLAEWEMTHNLRAMPNLSLYPSVEFTRNALNFNRHFAGRNVKTIEQMLDDEQPVAKGNIRVQPQAEGEIKTKMETSIRNRFKTKVLESAMLDTTDAKPFTFASFVLNHWLYLSTIGRYSAYINFDDPRSGQPVSMSVKDAFIVFLFAINRQYGLRLPQVPTIEADLVRKILMPQPEDLRNITNRKYLRQDVIDAYYDILRPMPRFISVADFREGMHKHYDMLMKQWFIWSQLEHYQQRGQAEIAGLYFYQDIACNLANEQSYESWFNERGMEYWDYDENESRLLAEIVFNKATGAELDKEISLAELQGALLRLMTRLSSYTVQFLQSINPFPIKILNWNAVRMGDVGEETDAEDHVRAITVTVLSMVEQAHRAYRLSIYELGVAEQFWARSLSQEQMSLNFTVGDNHVKTVIYRYLLPKMQIRNITEQFDDFEQDTRIRETDWYLPHQYQELPEAFLQLESPHYSLTDEERMTLQLRWDAYLADRSIANYITSNLQRTTLIPWDGPLFDRLRVDALDGFTL